MKKGGLDDRLFSYPRWESNPNLKFRKLPFYPLNYKGNPNNFESGREDSAFLRKFATMTFRFEY